MNIPNGKLGAIEMFLNFAWRAIWVAAWMFGIPAVIFLYPAAWIEELSDRVKKRWLITRSERKRKEIAATPEARLHLHWWQKLGQG
jgi:hypothetical protein